MAFVSHVGKVGTGRLSSFTGDDNCEVLAGTGMQTLLSQSSRRQHFLLKMLASFLAGLGLRNCGAAQSQKETHGQLLCLSACPTPGSL